MILITGSWRPGYSPQNWESENRWRGPTYHTSCHHRIRHCAHPDTLLHIWRLLRVIIFCWHCILLFRHPSLGSTLFCMPFLYARILKQMQMVLYS